MKKFLLVGLISLFGFIGFSSAGKIDVVCNSSNSCSPVWIDLDTSNLGSLNFNGSLTNCPDGNTYDQYIQFQGCESNTNCRLSNSLFINKFAKAYDNGVFNSTLNMSDYPTIRYIKVSAWGGCTINAKLKGKPIPDTNIVKDSEDIFPQVVTGISTVLGEFIPYVIYIGLGVLVVSIAFVAVKRLMLRIYNKVRFIFKKR